MNLSKIKSKILDIFPGVLMCIVIAYTGKFIGIYMPTVGGASLAIFLGMIVGNTFGNKNIYAKGSKFSESDLLAYSIVLLGGTLNFNTILKLGISGVGFIVIQMTITITAAILIGKKLGFSENFRLLMASGNAVCGSSAIASTAPVIGADDKDKGIAITIVNVVGTILMLLLPAIANLAFSLDTLKTSAMIGGVLQSVGQVIASGSLVNEDVKDLATIFKIVRIIFLIVVVLIFANMKKKSQGETQGSAKAKIPWYVMGFFIACTLYSVGVIPQTLSKLFKIVSSNFEIIALAGIGMRVKFKDLVIQGPKASMYGILIATVQIISALILINLVI
ncbi:putative integral membrane protein (TIGR00698 family) [Clostridium pascui]|uniref:YeiH family protein n=1 Tax=Clostridium pascui TaxID=46609 RepID=UPI00195F20AC|nr:putative sulfate exporter family transporter [Clostridium pascui]MBM7870673.1 putative integral membrane protein (TIGR00698 family) [Clostridium pascui]